SDRPNSRAQSRSALSWTLFPADCVPFGNYVRIGFAPAPLRGLLPKSRPIEPAECPDGCAAHQRRRIIEKPLGLGHERDAARVADRDQHVAQEPRTRDA